MLQRRSLTHIAAAISATSTTVMTHASGRAKAAAVFLNAHGAPGRAFYRNNAALVRQHRCLKSHSSRARAQIPHHVPGLNAQQGQCRCSHGLFGDQAPVNRKQVGIQPQMRAARGCGGNQHHCAGRAKFAAGGIGKA